MTITITLPPETEARLRQRATDSGQSLDSYVRQLVERAIAAPSQTAGGAVEQRFQQLAAEWQQAVALLSSVSRIVQHPAYQAIIALGEPAVPLMLRDLQRDPDHWFVALRAITGADPVAPEAAAWVRWGKEHGYSW